ncbi:MAG: P-II family nitrogen regulator [Xanthomonadales bacterium]|nr:P-II family nitrogen regulator [Xanthomonadales bacterium]
MSSREMVILTDAKLITCIIQRGNADNVIKAARAAGAQGATVHYGRGMGVRERLGLLGVAVNVQKEVINIIVANEQAELIFERMYVAGNMDTPGAGIMFMTPVEKAATYVPKEVLESLEAKN